MPDYELQSVFHFTVSASDFERSLDFYRTLGFQLLRDNRDVVWPQFVADNFGMKRAQGRGSLLGLDKLGLREHAAHFRHARLDGVALRVEVGQALGAAGVGVRIELVGPARDFTDAFGHGATREALRAQDRVHLALELAD